MEKYNYEEAKKLVLAKTENERKSCLISLSKLLNRGITEEETTKFENKIFDALYTKYAYSTICDFLKELGFHDDEEYNKAIGLCMKYLNIVKYENQIIETKISEREHLQYLLRRKPTDAELTKYARNMIFLRENESLGRSGGADCHPGLEADRNYKIYMQGKDEALKRAKSRYASLSTYDKSFYGTTYGAPRWSEIEKDDGIDFGFLDILYTEHNHVKEENMPKTYHKYFSEVDDKKRKIERYDNANSLDKIKMRLKGEALIEVTEEEVDRIGNCYFLQYRNLDICVLKEEDLKSVKQIPTSPGDSVGPLEPERTISTPVFKEKISWKRYGFETNPQFGDLWTVVEYIGNGLYKDTITGKIFSYGIRENEAKERVEELREHPLGITISWDTTNSDRNRPNLIHVDEPLPLNPKMAAEISKTKRVRLYVTEMIDTLEENARKIIEEKYGSKVQEEQLPADLVSETNSEQPSNNTEDEINEVLEESKPINSEEEVEYIENEDEKEIVLKKVRENPQIYRTIDGKYRKDPDVALEAVIMDGLLLEFVSEKLKNEETIVKPALESNPMALKFASSLFKNDFNTVMYCVKRCGMSLQYASPNMRRNPEIVLEAVRQDGLAIEFADSILFEGKQNKNIIMEAVTENGRALKYVRQFKDDRDIVLKAVRQNGLAITFADSKYFDDEEIVLIVLNQPQCRHLVTFISERLQNDLNFMKKLGEIDRSYLRYASPEIKDLLRIELLKSTVDSLGSEEIENNNGKSR